VVCEELHHSFHDGVNVIACRSESCSLGPDSNFGLETDYPDSGFSSFSAIPAFVFTGSLIVQFCIFWVSDSVYEQSYLRLPRIAMYRVQFHRIPLLNWIFMILCYGNKIPQYWLLLLRTFRIQLSGIMSDIRRICIQEKQKHYSQF
jgi:hypothetical protein